MTDKNQDLQELVESMKLDETVFTPEVMDKVKLVIESKVTERLEEEKEKLEEVNKEELATFRNELVDQLDEYINYFVEEFTKENEKDIIDSVKIKSAERVLENFNKMIQDFNISLSEETIDNTEKIQDLESDLNDSINENIEMKKEIAESNKYALILDRVMKMQFESQKSKFSKIAESFEYEDDESFNDKLDTLQESLDVNEDESDTTTNLEESEMSSADTKILTETAGNESSKSKYLKVLYRSA